MTAAGAVYIYTLLLTTRHAMPLLVRQLRRPHPSPTENPPRPDLFRPLLTQALTTDGGEVDLLIRTGGEKRLRIFYCGNPLMPNCCLRIGCGPNSMRADFDSAREEFFDGSAVLAAYRGQSVIYDLDGLRTS